MHLVSLLGLILTLLGITECYPQFRASIPNGMHVPDPCVPSQVWQGVGHLLVGGTRDLNLFGNDFSTNFFQWNAAICNKDSDGDGRSNGVELGDPNCTWTAGTVPAITTGITHPGICDPISSTACQATNAWLKCQTFSCPAFNESTTQSINLTFPYQPIPLMDTAVLCMNVKLPSDAMYHGVGNYPILNNSQVVHHVYLYGCPMNFTDSQLNTPYRCDMVPPPCNRFISLWQTGTLGQCAGDQYGFRFGLNGFHYGVLLIHYNNPFILNNLYDGSGIQFFYTPVLRPNDAMILQVGQLYMNLLPAPLADNVTLTGYCSSDCTSQLNPSTVNIATGLMHMHYQGYVGTSYLMRNGTAVMELINSNPFDTGKPTFVTYDPPVQLHAGDAIQVNCQYHSIRSDVIHWGHSTYLDEMCYNWYVIYPTVPLFDNCVTYQGANVCPILKPAVNMAVLPQNPPGSPQSPAGSTPQAPIGPPQSTAGGSPAQAPIGPPQSTAVSPQSPASSPQSAPATCQNSAAGTAKEQQLVKAALVAAAAVALLVKQL